MATRVLVLGANGQLARNTTRVFLAEVALTENDLAEIERAAAEIRIEGERYPEQLMATTGR